MGHGETGRVGYCLPDGRPLPAGAPFRVPEGAAVGLVGASGAGRTTLLGLLAGD